MRLVGIALLAATSVAGLAQAGVSDFERAHSAGVWLGCVEQVGYEPYPIRLTPDKYGQMNVDYPTLCSGLQIISGGQYDVTELITRKSYNCIPRMDINYELSNQSLWLEFSLESEILAYAKLHRAEPTDPTPSCKLAKVIS